MISFSLELAFVQRCDRHLFLFHYRLSLLVKNGSDVGFFSITFSDLILNTGLSCLGEILLRRDLLRICLLSCVCLQMLISLLRPYLRLLSLQH